jgi:thiosulfate/3-mercaptopyruvate sulfurtransferase
VETGWVAKHLRDPDLRILECTVFFIRRKKEVTLKSGRAEWEMSHIPGSVFVDLIDDLSDPNSSLRFTLPGKDRFAEAMSNLGVGNNSRVVLYDRAGTNWAARVWWMLRYFGFENASVLHGGWTKWTAEGRAVTQDVPSRSPGEFKPAVQPGWLSRKEDVISAIQDDGSRLMYTLDSRQYDGKRIPGSCTITAASLLDPQTETFLPHEELMKRFSEGGVLDRGRVISYCGSGIAASLNTLVLFMLGKRDISVYDGSLLEWMSDPSRPVETD